MITTILGIAAATLFPQATQGTTAAEPTVGGATTATRAQELPAISQKTTAAAQDSELSRLVDVSVTNAPLAEVLKALSANGLSFVVEETERSRTAKFTIQVTHKPLNDVLEAIADVYGGQWTSKGGIFRLKPSGFVGRAGSMPLELRSWTDSVPPEAQKSVDEAMKSLKEHYLFTDAIPLLQPKKALPEHGGTALFDEQEVQKLIEEALKSHGLTAKAEAELKAKIGDLERKTLPHAQGTMSAPTIDTKALDAKAKAMHELLQKQLKDSGGIIQLHPGSPMSGYWVSTGQDLGKLLNSLTPSQIALQKKQGFLKVSDLSSSQKAMLGKMPVSGWSITYTINGKTLKLRAN